ncbi:MAG TPA: CHAT domain-containing protein, partial [Thermoanaerobaculia bacterium]
DHAACPDPDTLAAFAEGKLKRQEMPPILAHLTGCVRCTAAVEAVNEDVIGETQKPSTTIGRGWWLMAAAIVIVMLALPAVRELLSRRSPLARLVALAPTSARVVEPRLSGGFGWAAYAGADRAVGEKTDTKQMKLAGAAGDLVERADRDRGADAQHAAGVAMVLIEKPEDAIPRLEAAAGKSSDARTWSDLAAARYAAASQLGRASLYPMALAAADTALRADPKLPEALFNRALILERLGLMDEARQAWQRYLEVDPSSQWATEARARLADLPHSTRRSQFDRERPLLEEAAARGDTGAVHKYVDAHRDRARAYAETEYLGRWGDAFQRNDAAGADRWLSIARGIGNALTELSGDGLTREAVQSIDRATAEQRRSLAAAHVAYRGGRIAYSRRDLDTAQRDLQRAGELFDAGHDPMAMAARFYAAGVRLARGETADARIALERVRSEADSHPAFITLGAHIRWELGRIHLLDDDFSGAAQVLGEGAAMFQRTGERANEAFVEVMRARALAFMGRADDEWLARIRAFAALSAEGESELLTASLDAAMRSELHDSRGDAALAISDLGLATARTGGKPVLVLDALVNQVFLLSSTGHPEEALRAARQAELTARGAGDDPTMRARYLADVAAATGAALAANDPRGAATSLTQAIAFYTQHNLPFALPQPLLLRARCASRTGDAAAAMRDLEEGMAIVEHGGEGQDGLQDGLLDPEHALFTDAIRIRVDRGDTAGAFALAERSRRGSDTIANLQRRLAGSGVAVLEISVLPGEVVTFAVTENDSGVGRRARSSETLPALAGQSVSENGTAAASVLYDDLIRPVEAILGNARTVIIIPATTLRSAAFSALYDGTSRRYLIERFAVATAASSSSLQRDAVARNNVSMAAISLPSAGATDSAALPDGAREIGDIVSMYRNAQSISPGGATLAALHRAASTADVLHITGHTESQPNGGDHALLLTGGAGTGVERVSSKTILASMPTHSALVVLAACETLRPPASAATHALSLGEAFSAAGATDVVGTLAPVGDRDARLLFTEFHRQVANGARPVDALRTVQQEAIAADPERGGRRSWRAVALLTRRIPAPK